MIHYYTKPKGTILFQDKFFSGKTMKPPVPSSTDSSNKQGTATILERLLECKHKCNQPTFILYSRNTTAKICLSLSLLLTIIHIAHSQDLSGHPGRGKTYDTVTEKYKVPEEKTWIAIVTQDYFNCQTSKSMPNLLMTAQEPFLEVSPYFNQRISVDTKGPISPYSDGNS